MDVLTIGNFDGVHLGHRRLVQRARELAGRSGRVTAVTFEPLPAAVLRPGVPIERLSDVAARGRLLRDAGCDDVLVLDPRDGLLGLDPAAFVVRLRESAPFAAVVEGRDFRFGAGRAGDIGTLRELGRSMGFDVEEVPDLAIGLADAVVTPVRSTTIRWLLAMGRVADAARLLGRPHAVAGPVREGDRRGRTLGFPTANVDPGEIMLPADGVYAAEAIVDGQAHRAAVSVGTKPTFGGAARTCEAHVVGLSKAIGDYGWALELRFTSWLRSQWRFPGPAALVDQLRRDVGRLG
jgi:riboflavin kinase/FMN adenylyltransferase